MRLSALKHDCAYGILVASVSHCLVNFKKLILWLVLGFGAYYGIEYYRVQSSGDVVAYKRFAQALLNGRLDRAQLTSSGELVAKLNQSRRERDAIYSGQYIVFTHYEIHARRVSPDGKTAFITGDQVCRVNPPGIDTLWGQNEIRVRQSVKLEYKHHLWKVTDFVDPAAKKLR